MASEYRTSVRDINGNPTKHPKERRKDRLKPPKCRAENHGPNTRGCRCYCKQKGCENKRTIKYHCDRHRKRVPVYDVSYSPKSKQHRMWNRDVLAAINIGCRLLASLLGIKDLSIWDYNTTDSTKEFKKNEKKPENKRKNLRLIKEPKSWEQIFEGHTLPFRITTLRPKKEEED